MSRMIALTLLLAGNVALAEPAAEALHALVQQSPELTSVFRASEIRSITSNRAEASAEAGGKRHGVVLYRDSLESIGDMYCNAALGYPERRAWLNRLTESLSGDSAIAARLFRSSAPSLRFTHVEYGALKSPRGWKTAVCQVPLGDIKVEYPALPDQQSIHQAEFDEAKQLFSAGCHEDALERLKRLRNTPLYPDALLFVIASLEQLGLPMAEPLRRQHVRLDQVNDSGALRVFLQASEQAGMIEDAVATLQRCNELGIEC